MTTQSSFVVRSHDGTEKATAGNIVTALRKFRKIPGSARVFKVTPEGEVLMAYRGKYIDG
jgi:hypothetical protein